MSFASPLSRRAILAFSLVLAGCRPAAEGVAPSSRSAASGAAPSPAPTRVNLTVFAAASLTEAFQTIGRDFERETSGVRVRFSFAGSQQLAQQIVQGAPADVFASANRSQMDVVVNAGAADRTSVRIFARNRLVVIYPKSNPTHPASLQDLARPGMKIVLADPSVPVGQYARDFLARASADPAYGATYQTAVLKNVVSYEQDVKAVLSKVALDEADAGVVYTTDVTPDTAAKLGHLDIPDQYNTIAAYPIVALRGSKYPDVAQRFVDYVRSPAGQAVLARFGFLPPADQASAVAPGRG